VDALSPTVTRRYVQRMIPLVARRHVDYVRVTSMACRVG
jgi:hypothetical protein